MITWSNDLAYAIGLITTDGNLSKDGRHINLTSLDLEQIHNFADILHLNNKVSMKKSSYTGKKKYYFLQFGNIELYKFLLFIGLMPNKTKKLGSLLIPDKYLADYLRGFLDGDGFTYSYWDKRWKSSFMLYTGFVSASYNHLVWMQGEINRLYGIRGTIKLSGRSAHQLLYAKHESLTLLKKIYSKNNCVCLSRKRFKIEKALGIIRKHAGMLELVDRHA